MSEDAEFEKIRSAIEAATDVVAGAIEKHGNGQWDYLIVAIPMSGHGGGRVAMMASVMPNILPSMLAYLAKQMQASEVRKVIEINGVPEDVKPS